MWASDRGRDWACALPAIGNPRRRSSAHVDVLVDDARSQGQREGLDYENAGLLGPFEAVASSMRALNGPPASGQRTSPSMRCCSGCSGRRRCVGESEELAQLWRWAYHWLLDSHRSLQSAPAPLRRSQWIRSTLCRRRTSEERSLTVCARPRPTPPNPISANRSWRDICRAESRSLPKGLRIVVKHPARPSDSPNAGEVPNVCSVPAIHPFRPT
jgi:hypothetical protein